MTLERIDLSVGQKPTEADWEAWLNRVIDYVNAGIPAADLAKTAGKVAISITGDADTVDGLHAAEIVGGSFPQLLKTLIDLITGTNGKLVITGGVATKNGSTANQLDITAIKAIQRVAATGYIDRVELSAKTKTTVLAGTVYYLDLEDAAADYTWGTSHPAGDYIPIAEVTTDASANISVVTDVRPLAARLLYGYDSEIDAQDFLCGVLDQTSAPAGNTTATTGMKAALSWIVNRLRAATGAANWWGAPDTTLAAASTHIAAASPHSGHALTSRQIIAGAGLTGGGDLTADRTLSLANVTADPAIADAYALTGTLTQQVSWIVKNIKALKGTVTNWYDAAAATVETIWSKFHATTGHVHSGEANDAPKVCEKGTYSDTTTSINSQTEYTASIALGFAARFGQIVLRGSAYNSGGALVLFDTVENNAMFLHGTTDLYVRNYGVDGVTGNPYAYGTNIYLKKAYISGSNLNLVFFNNDASVAQTLNVTASMWQVWR